MKKLINVLDLIMVIAALAAAVYTARNIGVESLLRGSQTPVTAQMADAGYSEDYIGMPAGDDIPQINDIQTWESLWGTEFVTVKPKSIISTGIGARNQWIPAYQYGSGRRRARAISEVSGMAFDILNEYSEYYLIELPDGSYILAQLPREDARSLKAGRDITLPVGRKQQVKTGAVKKLEAVCGEYNAAADYVFYCINDKWNEKNELLLLVLRLAVGAVVLFSLGTMLIMMVNKLINKISGDSPTSAGGGRNR